MRLSIDSRSALARPGARLLKVSAASLLLVATAWGQAATSVDPRYSLPPEAAADPASAEEPLINWRRDAAQSTAASSESVEETNPLRKSAEPPPQFAPIAASPAVEPIVSPPTTTPANDFPTNPALAAVTIPNPIEAAPSAEAPASAPPFAEAPAYHYDPALQPAAHQTESPARVAELETPTKSNAADESLTRRLAPPTSESSADAFGDASASASSPLPFNFSKLESLSTAGVGLAVVIGLFLVCMMMLRRGGPKANGALPSDAFAVLGRAPLTPQTFAHLLRVGNKLVLVAMTPGGVQPLTEVTDPMEVDRLTGLCASGRGHGPSAEFQQVLAQLSREPARGFLGAEATGGGRRR
ncbi:MAG: flagellar biosynthetic protein FliO [Pirellulales bacterium]|nr:flagellar biosynthetic protein FliO [Pirellulales bacterium]